MRDISKYMLSKTASKVMDPQKKIEICISAAEKIQKLHDAGYLHCDIKGENFLVDEKTGEVFLLDYGAAYPIDNLSSNTALFGTETYVASEVGDNIKTRWLQSVDGQLQEISDIDLSKVPKGSSDVYSFGRFLEADMGLKRSDLCGIVSNVLSRDPSERPTMPQIIDILKLYKALALEVSAEPEKVAKMLLKNGTREQFALVDERLYDIMHPSEPKTASQKLAELGAIADSDTVAPFSAVRQQCIEAIKSDCMSRVQEIMSVMFTPAHTPSKRLTVEDLESSVIDKVHQKTIGDADDDERDEVDEEAELGRTSQFK
jgi:serine/threonine protein kinase